MGARLRKRRARIPTADRGRQTSNKRYGNHCRGDRSVLGLCTEDIETEEIKSRKGLPTHCIDNPFLFFYKSTFNLPKLPAHPPIPALFRISKSNKPGYHRCRLHHRLTAVESKPHIYLLQPYVAKQLSNQI